MSFKNYKNSIAHNFMLLTLILYVVDFMMDGIISDQLSLTPEKLMNDLELWRLATFPFASGPIEGIILFAVTFFIFAPRIEKNMFKMALPLIILLTSIVQGSVFTLIFWKQPLTLQGMEGVSFFILTLFSLLNTNKKISSRYFKAVNTIMFVVSLEILWLISTFVHYYFLHQSQLMMVGMSHGLFGLTIGFIVFLNIRFSERVVQNKNKKLNVDDEEIQDYSPALISQNELKEFGREIMDELQAMEHDSGNLNEDRLNQILDKIIESGKNSLTPSELLFLDEYSKNIK
jgi:membrane associated rhomboid family serine protease